MRATPGQAREFVRRLLALDIRDKFKGVFCRYCDSLCSPLEIKRGRCPNCASMRRAMKEMCAPKPGTSPEKEK